MRCLLGIPVSIELFETLITEGCETKVRCIKGVPKGAKMVNSFYDGYRQTAILVYEHHSFDDVPEGGEIPIGITEMETID